MNLGFVPPNLEISPSPENPESHQYPLWFQLKPAYKFSLTETFLVFGRSDFLSSESLDPSGSENFRILSVFVLDQATDSI